MKSWKTTLAGVAGMVAAIAGAVQAQFDGDPATVANWEVVFALFAGGIGLLFARDNDKSSESVGANKT